MAQAREQPAALVPPHRRADLLEQQRDRLEGVDKVGHLVHVEVDDELLELRRRDAQVEGVIRVMKLVIRVMKLVIRVTKLVN